MSSNLIGKKATIVGYSETGDDQGGNFVAHICLDIEDGPRVFFQANDPAAKWEIVEEPDPRISRGTCTDCKKQDGPCWCGDSLGCTC